MLPLNLHRFKQLELNLEPEVFYRPQIRFREGIVFTGICLLGGITSNASWDK